MMHDSATFETLKEETATAGMAPGPGAAYRVLIFDQDPAARRLLRETQQADPARFTPAEVETPEEALRLLSREELDCLIADLSPPDMDGLQLLVSARKMRPRLRIVVVASAPTDELHQAAVESGAVRFLSKPLDLENLRASLASDRPGELAYLKGDFDLLDLCRLSAACHPEGGGILIRDGRREGVLAHRGATLVHATAAQEAGAPAWESLKGWSHWHFESLPATSAELLARNCSEELWTDEPFPPGSRAGGCLRGLTLRHLIEWAIRDRLTGTLTVAARRRRTGALSFEAGRILRAETADREGGRAAAEILGWKNLRVELIRSQPTAPPVASGGGLQELLQRFCEEVEGWIATSVIRRRDGALLAGRSNDSRVDPAVAASCYLRVIESHLAAVEQLGTGNAWGETEDLLITTGRVYLLIRRLGEGHYHWLAVSSDSNLALCRLLMRSYEPLLRSNLESL